MKSIITHHLEEFTHKEGFFTRDRRALNFFQNYPENTDRHSVLLKTMDVRGAEFIDYQTHASLANHILSLNIDPALAKRDTQLVDQIAKVDIRGQAEYFYTFASRYCSYHHPDAYPIYSDTMTMALIEYAYQVKSVSLTREDLRDYLQFKQISEEFRKDMDAESLDYYELDKFMWVYQEEITNRLSQQV